MKSYLYMRISHSQTTIFNILYRILYLEKKNVCVDGYCIVFFVLLLVQKFLFFMYVLVEILYIIYKSTLYQTQNTASVYIVIAVFCIQQFNTIYINRQLDRKITGIYGNLVTPYIGCCLIDTIKSKSWQ